MRVITTRRDLIAPWLRMRRSLAQFSGLDALCRMPWSAGCIINASESKFSVHTAGLFVSWNGPLLISAATRLQGIFFWDLLVYLLEGLVFLVTGLSRRTVLDRLVPIWLRGPLLAVLLTVAVVIVARFVWVFPATYLPRRLSRKLARRDPAPPWRQVFFLAFVGVRGVVSLAAALAIPLTTLAGAPFPYRDLILFVTFGGIVVTLI